MFEYIVYKRNTFVQKNMADTKKGGKKGKKDQGEGGPKKAEITVIINEQEASKIIQNAKVITVHDLARQTGVKVSAAGHGPRSAKMVGSGLSMVARS